jgi:hypothetical protein
MADQRICFAISPIGEDETDVRHRADVILNYVIKPAVEPIGFRTVRSDQIEKSGIITSQIIDHLVNDPLVVADLTNHNANVFFELAIRHMMQKPVIHLYDAEEPIPFDVRMMRAIPIHHARLEVAKEAERKIAEQAKHLLENPTEFDTPISIAIKRDELSKSENPIEQGIARIMERLDGFAESLQRSELRLRRLEVLSQGGRDFFFAQKGGILGSLMSDTGAGGISTYPLQSKTNAEHIQALVRALGGKSDTTKDE